MITRAEITMVRSLADRRARTDHGLFVAEGRKMVREVIDSGWGIEKIYTTAGEDDYSGHPAEHISPAQFERISRLKSPQGVLALVRIPEQCPPEITRGRLVLALDGVQDPGNLGTVIRLADWFGIRDVLCGGDTADRFNPKTVQATMGSLFRVRCHYGDLGVWLQKAAEEKIAVYGAFLDGDNIYSSDLEPSGIVVMGSEGSGISAPVSQFVTRRIFIPPFFGGGAESLNVAMAATVVVSEFRRRTI